MDSNMDMDMAWCLLCSKRTRDTRTLYCSDECRQNDISKADSPPPLTSPLPPLMSVTVSGSSTSTPPRKASTSPVKKPLTHSPLIPAADAAAPSRLAGMVPQAAPVASLKFQRDRRAFSFPNSQLNDTPTRVPKSRQQSINAHHALPPFVRKSSVAMPTTSASPRLDSIDESLLRPVAPGQKLSKSTGGANTPIKYDTVFCSTSESSDNEALGHSPVQNARPVPKLTMTTLSLRQTGSTLPTESNLSTLRSQLSPRQKSHLRLRDASQSPVAALIASSASSRSREDIISWAKAISVRDTSSDDDDDADDVAKAAEPRCRGRSRTRRESKPTLPPHTETGESEAEHDGSSSGPGTTPKGRIGSSLAGLALAPIVKVLSSAVSSPRQRSQGPPTSSLGLQSVPVPAAAEVSRIAVVAMTVPPEEHSDAPPSMLLGGATPTLSTISFSEAAIDNTDSQVDIITDYQSSAPSDYFHRRASVPAKPRTPSQARASQPSVATPGTPGTGSPRLSRPKSRSSLPLRPISNTASAFWSLSSYIRSFAPFSISSVMGPYAPFAAAQDSSSSLPTPAMTTPSTLLSPSESAYATAPLPAQSRPDSPESPEQEMVRSLPMDIIVPPAVASEERVRQPSIARSRRSRSRTRSIQAETPSTRAQSPARHAAYEHELCDKLGGGADLAATARRDHQCYYDADGSGDEDLAVSRRSDDRRGRSRKGKKLGSPRLLGAMAAGREGRSRGREREASEADSRPRGRGRDRSVRPL